MDWVGLFLRLDGRIGRKAFWVGFGAVALGILLADLISRGVGAAAVLTLALLYPLTAVLVKRLHDRGRSGWWAAVISAPLAVALLSALIARILGLGEAGIERAATGAIWITVAVLAVLAIIELGLRRGDPGYSEHGPPPLA
jgi:uncharacterized membrane protein YhaH (DUF805 family)